MTDTRPSKNCFSKPSFDLRSEAQAQFEKTARAAGYDPDDRWIGGYVDYEWHHLRLLLASYELDVQNKKVLEFGCNVGGSAIVLAALGAEVTAIDNDPEMVRIARANADRHGFSSRVAVLLQDRGAPLPLPKASFDLVIANSVLEYVDRADLARVIEELHRILSPKGQFLVCGTASRLAPREVHSRRWLVNYIPRAFDRLFGSEIQRGLNPFQLCKALRGKFFVANLEGWERARYAIHQRSSWPVRMISAQAARLKITPGWLSPNIELLLQKQTRPVV